MRIEITKNRVFIEAQTEDEEKILEKMLDQDLRQRLQEFLGECVRHQPEKPKTEE